MIMAIAGSHLYHALVYEIRDGDVTEINKRFTGVRDFRAWCRARYGTPLTRLSKGEYIGTADDVTVSAKLDKVY